MIHIPRPNREMRHGRMQTRAWCGQWWVGSIETGQPCPACPKAAARAGVKITARKKGNRR